MNCIRDSNEHTLGGCDYCTSAITLEKGEQVLCCSPRWYGCLRRWTCFIQNSICRPIVTARCLLAKLAYREDTFVQYMCIPQVEDMNSTSTDFKFWQSGTRILPKMVHKWTEFTVLGHGAWSEGWLSSNLSQSVALERSGPLPENRMLVLGDTLA